LIARPTTNKENTHMAPTTFRVWEDGSGELCVTSGLGIFATSDEEAAALMGPRGREFILRHENDENGIAEWRGMTFRDLPTVARSWPALAEYLFQQYGTATSVSTVLLFTLDGEVYFEDGQPPADNEED
jgi:hypothetical protein